ncbi:hypothetical protein V9T40_010596 [Parthenolecanium corni]|uniref:Uncharacterized protein n=1 Tax=Parthenolecanium corni TaxID=536013 RepID=A0AAN9T4G5_9HEMI
MNVFSESCEIERGFSLKSCSKVANRRTKMERPEVVRNEDARQQEAARASEERRTAPALRLGHAILVAEFTLDSLSLTNSLHRDWNVLFARE